MKILNLYITYALFKKESFRFLKVYHQTLFSPVIQVMLLFAIFTLAIGDRYLNENLSFNFFIGAGLIIMVAMQNAFANSSSSLIMGKVIGHIIDYLVPPFKALELVIAITLSALLRAILVAIISFIFMSLFVDFDIYNYYYLLFSIIFASIFLAVIGILCGIFSDNFDQMSAITNYLITPLTFLSGTFYSISNLSLFWQNIAYFNPFFYMIDIFRYGLIGYHDGNLLYGIIYILFINIIFFIITVYLIDKGYKIKS